MKPNREHFIYKVATAFPFFAAISFLLLFSISILEHDSFIHAMLMLGLSLVSFGVALEVHSKLH